jgi:hypothetical protein
MNPRVWHASRDPYHCAYRLLRLLLAADGEIELERARILDIFLLFPSLIHRPHLTSPVRKAIRELNIIKPEDEFVNLPSAASIFQDLRMYQNVAVTHLAAKGILKKASLKEGVLSLQRESLPTDLTVSLKSRDETDSKFAEFLVNAWKEIPLRGSQSMYRRIGLPIRAIAA